MKFKAVYNKYGPAPGKPVTSDGKIVYKEADTVDEARKMFVDWFKHSQTLSSFQGKVNIVPEDQTNESVTASASLLQTVLAEANAQAKALKEARSGEAQFVSPAPGQLGMMLVLDDVNPMIGKIAAALGIPKGYKEAKVGNLWAAYNEGDRLVFAEKLSDLMGDEVRDDPDEHER